MNKYLSLLILPVLLAACQSGPSQYVMAMQKYQGKTEAQLIDALGPPDNQYNVDGLKYLTYSKVSTQTYPTGGTGVGIGLGGYPRGSGVWMDQTFGGRSNAVHMYRCDVFFTIRNRIVDKVGHRGNSC